MAGESLGPRAIETRADLALELTLLRQRAGLTVRQLATRTGTPSATLGDYFAGRHLPGPAQLPLFRRLLSECDVSGDDLELWVEALMRVRRNSDGRSARAEAPYRGLEPFEEQSAHLFFGREVATRELLERLCQLRAQRGAAGGAILVLTGPSGTGKSSLLRAGLIPAVRQGALDGASVAAGAVAAHAHPKSWKVALLSPGQNPANALDAALASVGEELPLLVVVDQFEEVLTDQVTPEQQGVFLGRLVSLEASGALVVLALRADFYEAAARMPPLLPALRHAQVLLGPMTEQEVRRAIVEPAKVAGVAVGDGLVELLLSDLVPRSPTSFAHDIGALPLLSYALLATWQRSQRNQLTLADYKAAGGLRGAVRQSADGLYQALSPEEQKLTRQIFIRLVNIEGDSPLTRRRVPKAEIEDLFITGGANGRDVLSRFVTARLITAHAGCFEVSHEALLAAWPRLAEWIEADRAGVLVHRQLTEAANQWVTGGRDESLLLRGPRLEAVAGWANEQGRREQLNRAEQEFLDAGLARAGAEQRAAQRRTRQMQQLLVALGAFALAAAALAGIALKARADANETRDQALSRQVATEAQQLEGTQPALAMQLAVAAYRISPTYQARSALIDMSAGEMPTRLVGPPGSAFTAYNPARRVLAIVRSVAKSAQLYSLAGGHPSLMSTFQTTPAASQGYALSVSPNGLLLAVGGIGDEVGLWDISNLRHPESLGSLKGFGDTIYSLAFSPDGHRLAGTGADGTVRYWDVSDPRRPVPGPVVKARPGTELKAIAWSPNGRLIAAAGSGGQLFTWVPGSRRVNEATAGGVQIESLAFDPDGRSLVTGDDDSLMRVWSVGKDGVLHSAHSAIVAGTSYLYALAFSPDGRTIASGDADGGIKIWSAANWSTVSSMEVPNPITSVTFIGGGELVSASSTGTVLLWPLPPPSTYTVPGNVDFLDFADHGHLLGAVTGGAQGDISFWSTERSLHPVHLAEVGAPGHFGPIAGSAALSPNGRLLAAANVDGLIQLVDISDLAHPRLVGPPLRGAVPLVEQISFSPNGRLLAEGDDGAEVRLWDMSTPSHPLALPALSGMEGKVQGFSFNPSGRLLAAASTAGVVWLWDVSDPAHPKKLAKLGGFTSYVFDTAITPDGRTLIAGSGDGTVRLWDIANAHRPVLLGKPLTGPTGYVYQLAVSPDGRTLAAATTDKGVWLWDITKPAKPVLLSTLHADLGDVFAVSFSPDDRALVASGTDHLLHFWDYRASDVASLICSLAGSPITRSEWAELVPGAPFDPPCQR